ncbi:MAG: NADH-quinone oxidoreductase subunit J [Desulfuromonadaceae bacterium]|nr:NADH-quinone oxidoreductase subunit J [Desulfuromonadaceae bacterium]MDD5106617.1 NADH-quinone oxidoreductase subunit J [Desulfuromonadaceae bacterium]
MEQTLFYILAAVTVVATVFAISEKHPVHAIVYLVTSFFALAALFYLLAAPLIAMFEVIIYAGAIMVLFMFVIMMLDLGHPENSARPGFWQWLPALLLAGATLVALGILMSNRISIPDKAAVVSIRDVAVMLFQKYGVAIEIISMQLLFAAVGAFYLGRRGKQ